MPEKITSETLTTPEFKTKLGSLFKYLLSHLGIKQSPQVKIIDSESNANKPFGFTGHYDHERQSITLYITGRHETDILRSFAHEVIHHWQNERGTLKQPGNGSDEHYAQENAWLRRREMEAYLFGNLLFRDWQDEQRYGAPKTRPTLPHPLDENIRGNLENQPDMIRESIITGDFESDFNRVVKQIKKEWKQGNEKLSWPVIPKQMLLNMWRTYAKFGQVDEEQVQKLWELLSDILIKVVYISDVQMGSYMSQFNDFSFFKSVACPHLKQAGEVRTPMYPLDAKGKVRSSFSKFVSDSHGYERTTGSSIRSLLILLHQGYSAKNSDTLFITIDKILNFVHEAGPMAEWFVEGGTSTLDDIKHFQHKGLHLIGQLSNYKDNEW
jgi:hypothetical protein